MFENSAPSIQERVKMLRVQYLIQQLGRSHFTYFSLFFVVDREKFLVTPLIVHCLYTYGHRVLYTQCSKTSCICGMYYVVWMYLKKFVVVYILLEMTRYNA